MTVRNSAVAALLGLGMLAAPAITQAEGLADKLSNIQLSGFVDAAFFDTDAGNNGGITLDQVELDVEYSSGNVGLRFDLESSGDGFGGFEQGYVYYTVPDVGTDGLTFTFGKFNAPIGWELLDAPDMYQYSHAMVFNNALPTNLSGASLAAAFGMFDFIVYAANGTDTNIANAGGISTFGGRLGVSPMDGVNIGFSYLTGDNNGGTLQANNFTTFDVDLTIELVENLIIGAEYAQNKNWTFDGANSQGYFITAHYDFTDMFGVTGRFGQWDSGAIYDAAGTAIAIALIDVRETAATVAFTAALGDGLGALIEVRNHKAANTARVTEYAFEMTYGF